MTFKYCRKCYEIRQFVPGLCGRHLPKICDVCGGDE